MRRPRIVESFQNAIEGILYALRTQRNMKIHFLSAALIVGLGALLDLPIGDLLFLTFAIGLVLFAEMVNTAVELTIDLISETYHPLARIVKDVSAGAVFIAAINALVIGMLLFAKHLLSPIERTVDTVKSSPWYIFVSCLLLVLLIAVFLKIVLSRRGTERKKTLPSAQTALAFAIWTLVTWTVPANPLIVIGVFVVALMVGQSRVASGLHTAGDVILGGAVGVAVALLFLRLLV